MDFFEAQERARQRTSRLVAFFALAVLGTIAAGYLSAMAIFWQAAPRAQRFQSDYWQYQRTAAWPAESRLGRWWDPRVFLTVAAGTVVVVGGACLYKWSQMRGGGSAIAEQAGGRPVDLKSTDLRERRLLNVVEEMAIASGIPMPAVYVLEQEPGLNAFAAGLTTSDAAVAVTRGTLDKLTRDELQGVIGHEFSHILNGDMRLNVRIMAVVFGILVVGLLGRGILFSMGRGRVRTGGGRNNAGGVAVIFAVGLALLVIGYVGYFFGRLIQAAVSRQREFLADASAVQFTRNPAGIAGALKKIGGYALGGNVVSHRAAELGHFFFAQAFRSNFGGLWATHPPLPERIRAIEPGWDGQLFEPPEAVDIARESFATAGFGGERFAPDETARRVFAAEPGLPRARPPATVPFEPARVVADVGALTDAHFRRAQALLDSIPGRLRDATQDPASAAALVYGLLLTGDRSTRDRQQELVAREAGAEAAALLAGLRPALSVLEPAARLPLLQLTLPALRQLDSAALGRFAGTLDELVHADGRVTPFEYALQKMLVTQLQRAQRPAEPVRYHSFDALGLDIAVILSAFAHLTGRNSPAAFADGAARLPELSGRLRLQEPAACGFEQVDESLDRLAASALPIRRSLLVAAGHVIANDGAVTLDEGELYRALAATLDCPMPALGGPV